MHTKVLAGFCEDVKIQIIGKRMQKSGEIAEFMIRREMEKKQIGRFIHP